MSKLLVFAASKQSAVLTQTQQNQIVGGGILDAVYCPIPADDDDDWD